MKGCLRQIAMAATLAAGLGGCAGSLFQSKVTPPATYLLSVETGSAAASDATAPMPADLAILRPRVRTGLDSDHVAVLYPDRRLDFFAGARWSGPLDEMLQDLTVQTFQAGGGLRRVNSDASAFASTYWLELTVVDFQAEYAASGGAPRVHVHFTAQLGTAAERRVMGRFEVAATVAAADNRLTAIVDAYQHAAAAALGQLQQQTLVALANQR